MQRDALKSERSAITLLCLFILGYLLVLGLALVTYQAYPTVQQATMQILTENQSCEGHLQVTKITQNFGFTGPLLVPAVGYFLECQIADLSISIRIQEPDTE
jgi:hypothetical protein